MQPGPIPLKEIKTKRVLIRPARLGDAEIMHSAMKNSFESLRAWMPWAQSLASLRDTEAYLLHGEAMWRGAARDGQEQPLQIMDASDTVYFGATGIKPANLQIPSFEVGYWVNQLYAGQGIITEALNALTRYLLEVLHAKRVEINCEKSNVRSAAVAQRLNYVLEGTLRNHRLDSTSTKLSDSLIFSCIDSSTLPPLDYRVK